MTNLSSLDRLMCRLDDLIGEAADLKFSRLVVWCNLLWAELRCINDVITEDDVSFPAILAENWRSFRSFRREFSSLKRSITHMCLVQYFHMVPINRTARGFAVQCLQHV